MEQKKIDRINELARKQRTAGLSDAEKTEQANLRREYIEAFRGFLEGQLNNMVIQYPDGSKRKVKRREDSNI